MNNTQVKILVFYLAMFGLGVMMGVHITCLNESYMESGYRVPECNGCYDDDVESEE